MTEKLIGQTLQGRYRVDSFIASGGMGAVYRVWDLKRSVPLAMKVLHAELAEDPSVFKRFQREANALKKLAHPNIVPFYGLEQARDFFFLLEAYIDGPTLKEVLRERRGKPLPIPEALAYLKALCAALGYAHHHGVVHCDIKPGNVMLDRGGAIYLTDFGIARHAESTTTTLATAGTAAYMAPEQIRGEAVTPATDVYALGVLLYELLTGQRPFRGDEKGTTRGGGTANERLRYAHQHLVPVEPRVLNPTLPEGLGQVVMKALAKEPRERYGSVQELLAAACAAAGMRLEEVPERVAVGSSPGTLAPARGEEVSPPPSVSTKGRGGTAVFYLGGGAVVVILMAALIGFMGRQGPVPQAAGGGGGPPTRAIEETPTTEPPTATIRPTATQRQATNTPSLSPMPRLNSVTQGEWIIYSFGEKQNRRDLYLFNLITGRTEPFTVGRQGDIAPTFSPDGAQVAFIRCNPDCDLYLKELNGQAEKRLTDMAFKVMFPDWCKDPDKPWIIFEGRDDAKGTNIWMINVDTGEAEQLTFGKADFRPAWSPDCSRVLFGRANSQTFGDIYILNMETKQEKRLTSTPDWDEFNFAWSPNGDWIALCRTTRDTNGDGYRNLNDQADLILIKPDGSSEINLTQGRFSAFSPSWSPWSTDILFQAVEPSTQMGELWIYSLETKEFTQLTGKDYYYHARWSP